MAVEMFFSTVAVPAAGNDTNLQGVSPGEKDRESDSIMLLSGPPSCGKTSLLFQFALNSVTASETNRYVVFICNRRKLEAKPFYLFQGIDPSSDKLFLERIHIKYVDDDEGIMKYFAAFHLFPTCPAAVIIDDFAEFFDERECQQRYGNGNPRGRGRDLAMVRVLALCQNAIAHANEIISRVLPVRRHPACSCYLILTMEILQDSYSFTRDGFPPFSPSEVLVVPVAAQARICSAIVTSV